MSAHLVVRLRLSDCDGASGLRPFRYSLNPHRMKNLINNLIKLILVCFACFLVLTAIAFMIPEEWLEVDEPQEQTEEVVEPVSDASQEETVEEAVEEAVAQTPAPAPVEWYEGGTLHDATVGEWNRATYENKLATCGDFVAVRTNEISRDKAEELVTCIDESVKGLDQNSSVKVSEMAAACILLMGY